MENAPIDVPRETVEAARRIQPDDLNVFRVTQLNAMTLYLWLRRRNWIWYPFIFVMIIGLVMLAYGVYGGGDFFYPFGREGVEGYAVIIIYTTYLVTVCMLIWCLLPLLLFIFAVGGGLVCFVSGAAMVVYQAYAYLETGVWDSFGIGGLFDPEWLADRTEWVGLKEILTRLIEHTPLSLLLIIGGIFWLASGEGHWLQVKRGIVDRYIGLRRPADR